MTNEAVIIELLGNGGDPVRFTVADGNTVEKGTVMELSDARIASAANTMYGAVAGIAAAEKVADDGATTLACYTNGIFDLKCNPHHGITAGNWVAIASSSNLISAAPLGISGGLLGKALETATAGEVIAVKVNC